MERIILKPTPQVVLIPNLDIVELVWIGMAILCSNSAPVSGSITQDVFELG